LKVIDLFCGCGGISYGFELAGYNIKAGIDFNSDSIKTYAHNFPKSKAICGDILQFDDAKIIEEFASLEIDVVVGGPPCQGFSNANRWHKESDDPRNKLFYEYLRFVSVLKPKAIVIENVRGILTKDNGYAKKRIVTLIEELGYTVSSNVLNAADYGVPQNRYRAIFVAIKKDVSDAVFDFSKIKKEQKITVIDAIGELYELETSLNSAHILIQKPNTIYRKYLRSKTNLINNHPIVYPAKATQEKISYVPQGGNWQDIPPDLFNKNRQNRHSSAFKRLNESDCSVTIDTGNAHSNYYHPKFNRIPTVREAARIQSFKDDFEILGSRSSQYRQIGNAVPPLLARAIANELIKYIK
jgi:DNA (cytosine-5)-methyltransferase 1